MTQGIADNLTSSTVYNDVTIENGTISNFYGDIVLEGDPGGSDLTGAVVEKITTTNDRLETGYGLFGGGLSGASIHNLSISDADYGVDLEDSQASTVSHNQLQSPFFGLTDSEGFRNTWSDNTLSNVNDYGVGTEDATAAVVKSNTFSGGLGGSGIFDSDSSGTSITDKHDEGHRGGHRFYRQLGRHDRLQQGFDGRLRIYTEDSTDFSLTGNQFSGSEYGIETDCPVASC